MSYKSHSVLATTGDNKVLPELADRLRNTSVSVIKEMMYLGAQEKAKGKNIVSLGVGLPFYPAPENIHEAAIKALHTKPDIDKYTLLTGLPELRGVVAQKSEEMLFRKVSPEEILITPGSMAGLLYSFLALVNPGEEVILPSPYFSSNGEQVSIAGGIPIPVAMIEDPELGFRLDVEKIEKAITKKTKAIVLNNPQNPTGAVYQKEELLALAKVLRNKDIYVITDEVYDFLVFDNFEYFNIATLDFLWPKVIRCCSLSKKYGMMGWRIGYLHTNKDLLMNILKIHDANIVCAPHISQEAAIEALTGPQEKVKDHFKWLSQNRDTICKRLDLLPDLFSYVKPRGTYYVFPKYLLPIPSIEMAKRLLYEAGVVTVPGVGFGPEGEHHLRLSFGSPQKDIEDAFDRIELWWKKQK
ncbi:aminotransferase class I/II-fold pyridoxal phosphate-dependent enzyme [Patescibacteria group bacterium]|nr:aminotransferase class I/II-fold pyridoxal phosphate-dependent enzyme [Patescibacteria group bacterium]MCL5797460.1 aminotransferase class I/II-fold pyridoxal phosphate-dependent enzyme [Patescibacteria group bacterium]